MAAKTYTRSFAGGEISPLLRGRVDLAKNSTGLALCENLLVTPQGPVVNRAGFEYVAKSAQPSNLNSPVLLPFVYNAQQAFALEFGHQYIRFFTNGAELMNPSKAITGITVGYAAAFTIPGHGFVIGQVVQINGINGGMAALNGRWGRVASITGDVVDFLDQFSDTYISTFGLPAYTSGGVVASAYTLASPYAWYDLYDLHYVQSADVLTITHQNYPRMELRRLGPTTWTLTPISETVVSSTGATITVSGPGGGAPTTKHYVVTVVNSNNEESIPSGPGFATIDLTVAGNQVIITPTAVAGGIRYNVYKEVGGVFGYIGQTDGVSGLSDTNILPDMTRTPPLVDTPFAGENPRAVSYFEQRRWYGGGNVRPQNVWATQSGSEATMTYSIPSQDDDRISARIVARRAQTVRHLVPMSDLIALTTGGVWRIAASDGGPITPSTISFKPVSYVGASNVQPAEAGEAIIYAQDRGSHIRELSFKGDAVSGSVRYMVDDISVLAPHLFDFHRVIQMASATTPLQSVWMVRDDGVLLGLTYQPEHDVRAWHRHTTDGYFWSVCVIPEGNEDGIYVVVRRAVAGSFHYVIERMHTRQIESLEDSFFVDSGATYSGAPATAISGLAHLEGREVSILADGVPHPRRTVVNGVVQLDTPASKVHVGLQYFSDGQTLPMSLEQTPGFGQGTAKNINAVHLKLQETGAGVQAGPRFDQLREYPLDDGLESGEVDLALDPLWQQDGSVCFRQSQPLPMTLLAITYEVVAGG